jgi:hypothetical protein
MDTAEYEQLFKDLLAKEPDELNPDRVSQLSEDELLKLIIDLKETGSSNKQLRGYELFVLWEKTNHAQSAHTVFHAAHSLLLTGSIRTPDELAGRMSEYKDVSKLMWCDWNADMALASVRAKNYRKADQYLALSQSYLTEKNDRNRILRNQIVYGRIQLAQGNPYAKVVLYRIVANFKKLAEDGEDIDVTYFRNALWYAMVAAGRWQLKEVSMAETPRVFPELVSNVLDGISIGNVEVSEARSSRRMIAHLMKWSTPVGRPIVGYFASKV